MPQRRVGVDDAGVLPTVRQVQVGRSLGCVVTSELPDLAARWLALGLDTPLLRELAGHPRADAWGLEVLWRGVLEEMAGAGSDGVAGEGELAWVEWVPVELARWSRGEITSEHVSRRLLALQEQVQVAAVTGLGESILVEEELGAQCATVEACDAARDAALAELAADVLPPG